MKLFECQHCGQLLYFENTRCESCEHRLGYLPSMEVITALEPEGEHWRALAEPRKRYRFCANVEHNTCNWLIEADRPDPYCEACRHNRTIPGLGSPENLARWRRIESAKHRLFYTIIKLRLPLVTRSEDPDGLAFDFLAEDASPHGPSTPVMTGHANGLITINLAEADDVERERQRTQMGEPYRALLGHFRHEIAHYFWDRLIAHSPNIGEFRKIFGDEREDYAEALQSHYSNGPPNDWPERFVTSYASAHPWEDFAETWAHYLHMVDTLETARAFRLSVRPKVSKGAEFATTIDFDPHNTGMDRIIESWLPLTFAVNSINRSMGIADLYPFILSPGAIVKLTFIHELIYAQARRATPASGLKAIVASLRQNVPGAVGA
ncbi:MAG TPA: putative zinc-binding peptidase [Bradyrhizobium sp.]|nr:putative zinc-binding peptidase [Bradyrhizobium sp.]